ncbi:MAG: hypothetical protein NVS4B6_24580 [Mycobacterium sp.]
MQPFLVEATAALANEAVFVARNPQLLLRTDKFFVIFRDGEYHSSDPEEIEFLLGVVRDEARGNRGMQVRSLPHSTSDLGTGEPSAAPSLLTDAQPGSPLAVVSPAPSPTRRPSRRARKRGI